MKWVANVCGVIFENQDTCLRIVALKDKKAITAEFLRDFLKFLN
jgi:hypothetical protein